MLYKRVCNISKLVYCCHRGMVGKGLERQRSYPTVIGSSPSHAMVTVVLNSSPEL